MASSRPPPTGQAAPPASTPAILPAPASQPTLSVNAVDAASALQVDGSPYTLNIESSNTLVPTLTLGNGITGAQANPTINIYSNLAHNGLLVFNGGTAGSATINVLAGNVPTSALNFNNTSTAGSATINNDYGARLNFYNNSSGGTSTINNTSASVGVTLVYTDVSFNDNSTAGAAKITNTNYQALLYFWNTSNAGTATITSTGNDAGTGFHNTASAANATFINTNQGFVHFHDSSSAGSSNITNSSSGYTSFDGTATGANATITNNSGGYVQFNANSVGTSGTTINNNAGGTLDISGNANGSVQLGLVQGAGSIALGANALITGTQGATGTISGVIYGFGGSLVVEGPGTVILTAANTYTGGTVVESGTLVVGDQSNPGATIGAAQVDSGGTLAGYGTVGGNLVNSGTVQPGSGSGVGTLTVTGNYTQNSSGTLLIGVTPSAGSALSVSGTATLAGTVTVAYAPGTYTAHTYPFLTATGGVSSGTTFATVTQTGALPTALTPGVTYSANAVDFMLSGSGGIVRPRDESLFSDQDSTLAMLAQQAIGTLLGADGPAACGGPAIAGQPAATADIAFQTPFCQAGGWIQFADSPMQVAGSGAVPGFHANTAHLLMGMDWPIGDDRLRLGVALGYDQSWLSDNDSGQANEQVARIGVYGSARLAPVIFTAALSYGHDWNSTERTTGVGAAPESHGGNEVSGGAQARLPIALGDFTLTPMGGVRFAVLNENSFAETGSGALGSFVVSGNRTDYSSVVPYARLKLARVFVTADALMIAPDLQVGYDYQAGTVSPSVLLTAVDGTAFPASGVKLDRSSAVVGAGVSAGRGNWALFGNVHANIAGNWSSETMEVGFRLRL